MQFNGFQFADQIKIPNFGELIQFIETFSREAIFEHLETEI